MSKPSNPVIAHCWVGDGETEMVDVGVTLRDLFAAAALAGNAAADNARLGGPELTATNCYELADAMLAEREKP